MTMAHQHSTSRGCSTPSSYELMGWTRLVEISLPCAGFFFSLGMSRGDISPFRSMNAGAKIGHRAALCGGVKVVHRRKLVS